MEFRTFDGETLDGVYFLLGNEKNFIYDKDGLSTERCLDFLHSEGQGYKCTVFRLEFDVNYFVRDLPINDIKRFFNTEVVFYKKYKLQYYRNKIFKIWKDGKQVIIYDNYNFFNKSFLKVIDLLKIKLTEREKYILQAGKKSRVTSFDTMDLNEVIEYNKTECKINNKICDIIAKLMRESFFISNGKKINLYVKSFYGSSAIANKFLSKFSGVAEANFNYLFCDKSIKKHIESAYYGGRMEALKVGTFKKCYKYDINSAYPSILNNLRIIKDVKLNHRFNFQSEKDIKKENLYYASVFIFDIENMGLLPHRHRTGLLFFPQSVTGWFYGVELLQVLKYAEKDFIDVTIKKEIKVFLGDKIFNNQIETIYNLRKELKSKNDIKHYVYKIMLNSIYGKFAQKVGAARFNNFYYAGFITASTRAKLLEAVINNQKDIIFFATDGILSKTKLNLPVNDNLGGWEEIKIKKARVILSGVYNLLDYEGNVYSGERGFKLDFNKVFSDILDKGFSEVETQLFIGFVYGLKNHIKYGKEDLLKFKPLIKRIIPESNIKRLFAKIDLQKENHSVLFDIKDLRQLKFEFDFSEKKEVFRDGL